MITIMLTTLFRSLATCSTQTILLEDGEYVFHCKDEVSSVFLLEKGQLNLIRNLQNGDIILLNRSQSGDIIAEASIYSEYYHCSCVSKGPSRLLRLPIAAVIDRLNNPETMNIWAAYLANKLQDSRYRCEILTRNKVSERLAGWLEWHGALPPKGQWKNLAAEIGVSAEALYREIKRQRIG